MIANSLKNISHNVQVPFAFVVRVHCYAAIHRAVFPHLGLQPYTPLFRIVYNFPCTRNSTAPSVTKIVFLITFGYRQCSAVASDALPSTEITRIFFNLKGSIYSYFNNLFHFNIPVKNCGIFNGTSVY